MADDIRVMINDDYENEELFYKVTDFALDKEIEDGIDKLSKIEKNIFMVGKLIMEVNNGGFDQYFLNTEDGLYAGDTLEFLNHIEEMYFSKLLKKSIDIFESDSTDDEKVDEFNELDSMFYEFDGVIYGELYNRCISYLKGILK